jgi:caffeoyl-CoA O-methyltransferase
MRTEDEKESKRRRYLDETFGKETEVIKRVREHSLSLGREGMQLSPHEGQLLQSLVRWTGVKKILELGTLHGYSALWMASALPEGGHLWTVEKDSTRASAARGFFDQSPQAAIITLLQGDFETQYELLEAEAPFDLLFIDANKSAYYRALQWGETVVRKGGFIVADNSFLFGGVYGEQISERWSPSVAENMRQLNSRLADPELYQGSLIPTSEGLTVSQKRF